MSDPGSTNADSPPLIYKMAPFDVVHELLKASMITHYETVDLAEDVPLPIDLGDTWVTNLASHALDTINSVASGVSAARALATVAYDVTRHLHRHLCGDPAVEACRADTKTAADFVRILASVVLRCGVCAALHRLTAPHLETPGLPRDEVIHAIDGVLSTALCAISDNQNPLHDVGSVPIVQLNTAVSNVDDDDYLQMRTITAQVKPTIEDCGFAVEITSDYAAPSNRGGFVDEGRVRGRIYRSSAIVIFSRGAGDGSSATWTLAGELNIPTLVLRPPEDLNAATRFPGQMDARELHTYRTVDDAAALINDFLLRHRARVSQRAAYLCQLQDFDTEHLVHRMTMIDTDAFDNSMVTWERARFFTGSPVLWFQAHTSTSKEICRVLGIDGAAENTATADARKGPEEGLPPKADRNTYMPAADPVPSTGDRTRLSVKSLGKLLLAAENAGVDTADLHAVIEEWQRPGVLTAVSPRTAEPDFEGWMAIIERLAIS